MTGRRVGAVAGVVVALAAALLLLFRSRSEETPPPATEIAIGFRQPPPRAAPPAPEPPPPPPAVESEPPPAPVADEDAVLGRVLNAAGVPVAGAEVATLASKVVRGPEGADDFEKEERVVVTGEDGRFRIAPLRRDLPHVLRVRSDAHGDLVRAFDPRAEGPGVIDLGDLALPAARTILGLARESSGRPLAGATVRARIHEEFTPGTTVGAAGLLDRRATTDPAGRFRIAALSPGLWDLRLETDGREAAALPVRIPADRDPDPLELVVESGRTLVLVFVDEAGAPVEGMFVSSRGPGALSSMGHVRSDSQGRVELRALPRRALHFTTEEALLPGQAPRFAREEIGPVVAEGQDIHIVLRPPAFLRGRVLDGDGRPLNDLQIDLWEGERRLYSLSGFSRDEGRFEIPFVAGRAVELRVDGHSSRREGGNILSKAKPWRGSLGPVEAPADGLVLRCATPPTDRTLLVRVTDADGSPVRGAEVSWIGPEERCTAETGADGVARCKGMLAARTSVSCWSPRHGPVPDGQLEPEAVEVFPEGQLVEMAYRRGVPFTVVVKDSSGTGLPGVRIMPVSPGRAYMPRQGTTGLDGSCTFAVEEGLEFDELHVQWRSPQGGSTDATRHRVDTDSGELVVVLDPRR